MNNIVGTQNGVFLDGQNIRNTISTNNRRSYPYIVLVWFFNVNTYLYVFLVS